MATYDEDIKAAFDLIKEFGADTILTVFTAAVADPAMPWLPDTPAEQDLTAKMVFLNFPEQGSSASSGERYWEGTTIQQGDKKVLMAAKGLAFDPNLNAELTREDTSVWKVVNLKLLDPNGQKILWTMQVRR